MTRYWTADSDRDWQDSVGMYEEPPPEPEPEEPELSSEEKRQQALDYFFETVALHIPDTVPGYLKARGQVRAAGLNFAHVAVWESIRRVLKATTK